MSEQFINLTENNIDQEHLCCAISDKKHQAGVSAKKNWLKDRIAEGHVFRKLDAKGKVFIEYAPLETAWVPVLGEQYLYIYCLWVAGSYKGKGYGKMLLEYCIHDAQKQGKNGVCILSSKKKKPFLSEKKFLLKYGFQVADTAGDDYELLALSFNGVYPHFGKADAYRQQGSDHLLRLAVSLHSKLCGGGTGVLRKKQHTRSSGCRGYAGKIKKSPLCF